MNCNTATWICCTFNHTTIKNVKCGVQRRNMKRIPHKMKNGKCSFESVANLIITFNEKPIELPFFFNNGSSYQGQVCGNKIKC